MKIEISNEIAKSAGLSETEILEFLAVSLYKAKRINGVQGGKILGTSEIEFHGLLEKYAEYVNYGINEYTEDCDNLLVDPNKGGCWFCSKKDDELVFDTEFDTYVHIKCIREALGKDASDREAVLMKYLLEDNNEFSGDAGPEEKLPF